MFRDAQATGRRYSAPAFQFICTATVGRQPDLSTGSDPEGRMKCTSGGRSRRRSAVMRIRG